MRFLGTPRHTHRADGAYLHCLSLEGSEVDRACADGSRNPEPVWSTCSSSRSKLKLAVARTGSQEILGAVLRPESQELPLRRRVQWSPSSTPRTDTAVGVKLAVRSCCIRRRLHHGTARKGTEWPGLGLQCAELPLASVMLGATQLP